MSWLIFVLEQNWDSCWMAVQFVHRNYRVLIIYFAWSIQIHQLLLKQWLTSKVADLPLENPQVSCLLLKNTLWPLCWDEMIRALYKKQSWGGLDEGTHLSEVV